MCICIWVSLNRILCTVSIKCFELLWVLHRENEMLFIKEFGALFYIKDGGELRIK